VPSSASEPRFVAATGWVGLLALALAVLSGLLLSWHYRPEAAAAHASVVDLESATASGAAIRSLHGYATHLALIALLLHLGCALLFRRRSTTTPEWFPTRWLSGLSGLALVVLLAYSGRALPWDAHGATSVIVARAFLTVGDLGLLDAVLGRGAAVLPRLWLLHLALTGLLLAPILVHVPLRSALPALERRTILVAGAALAALVVIALVVRAPLGPPADPLAAPAAEAQWYLRWLQWVALRSPAIARLALLALLVLGLATPALGRRLGGQRLRRTWLATLVILALLSLVPVS